ncbi:MAG: CPBP family intramembrane glutamic endopeptidase [Caulobacteraceae bacterium]
MGVRGVWAGLAASPFLADVARKDRDPGRLFGTVAGGVIVGGVAALAAMILILAAYTIVAGLGGEGMAGLRAVAISFQSLAPPDLGLTVLELMVAASVNGAFAAAFVAVAALLAGHPLHHYVTAARRVRWRLLGAGLLLSLIVLGPVIAVDRLLSSEAGTMPILGVAPGLAGRAGYGLAALLLIPAAAAEELIFRGWLIRQLAAFTRRPILLIGLSAGVFSAAHLDISAPDLGLNPDDFLTRALMGAGFAYMTLRLGGIEFSTGAHAVNNILIVLFIEPLTLRAPSGAPGLSSGSLLEDLAMVAGYVAITEAVVRVALLRRWAGVSADEVAAPAPRPG